MRPSRRARVGVLVAAVLVAASTLSGVARGATRPPLRWKTCGSGFECAALTVPVDTSAPDATIDLAVIRARARDRERRIGTLVFNPGGPGVPAVEFLRSVASTLPDRVRDRFDLVAFDPRGVGDSDPIECVDSLDPVFDQPFEPTTEADRAALLDEMESLAQECAAHNGGLLAHVSTTDAVGDLEQLRVALGEERLSFVGYSYGTLLGATYADRHPERVRAMVLDGPVDPSMSARAVTLAQARGFEQVLDDFLADCAAHERCAFHTNGDAAGAYDALRTRAARAPLATRDGDGRTVNQTRFDAAVLQQLYLGRDGWSGLAAALAAADRGDASALLDGADTYVGRRDDGRDDHVLESFWAVTCLDGPVVPRAEVADLEARAVEVAPRMGAFIVNNSLPCSVWPVPPRPSVGRLTARGAPPILVVGTSKDPATPLSQARSLAGSLERGRLLVAEGEQHTSFNNGNRCVDDAVTRYLLAARLPRAATRC